MRATDETTRTDDSRMRATPSARASPRTKLMRVRGMVVVTVARKSGPSESRTSWVVCSFTTRSRTGGAGRLLRDVGREVLLRDLGQGAVGLEVGERLVDGGDEVGVLARRDDLLGDVTGLGRDLHRRVARRLQVVEDREAVVDGRVDTRLLEQRYGLGESLDRLDLGAGILGDLGPVARQALRRLLALEARERGDRRVVGAGGDDALGPRVGAAQAVEAGALRVLRDLVDDDVVAVGGQTGEDRVPRRLDVLDLDAELVGDGLRDLDVVAGQGVRLRVVERERRVGALRGDAQDARLLDGLEVRAATGAGAASGEDDGDERGEQGGEGEPRTHGGYFLVDRWDGVGTAANL